MYPQIKAAGSHLQAWTVKPLLKMQCDWGKSKQTQTTQDKNNIHAVCGRAVKAETDEEKERRKERERIEAMWGALQREKPCRKVQQNAAKCVCSQANDRVYGSYNILKQN